MKDCPEEFAPRDKMLPKWGKILSAAMGHIAIEDNLSVLTKEERKMVEAGLKAAAREMFTQDVMKALSGETEREDDGVMLTSVAHPTKLKTILTSANMVAQAHNILEEKLAESRKQIWEKYEHKTYGKSFSVMGDLNNE